MSKNQRVLIVGLKSMTTGTIEMTTSPCFTAICFTSKYGFYNAIYVLIANNECDPSSRNQLICLGLYIKDHTTG